MKFFNIDLHISVIADIRQIFQNLGHSIYDLCLSNHSFVFNRGRDTTDIINHVNWQSIDRSLCDRFYERYKNELSQFDCFICTYPPAFSLLYERFEKPIIIQCPIRYEVPFQNDKAKLDRFNSYLKSGIDNKQIILIANNRYDQRYLEESLDRECKLIPSYCDYTGIKYEGNGPFLYSSLSKIILNHPNIKEKHNYLGPCYKWSQLNNVKGIIEIPYNISTMSIFEYYTAGIPLIFPSPEFNLELHKKGLSLQQLSWTKTNKDTLDWIKLADYYDSWMPYLTYFDSFGELDHIIETLDCKRISENMNRFNILRKDRIYSLWSGTLDTI